MTRLFFTTNRIKRHMALENTKKYFNSLENICNQPKSNEFYNGDNYMMSVSNCVIDIWVFKEHKLTEKDKKEIKGFLEIFYKKIKGVSDAQEIEADLMKIVKEIPNIKLVNTRHISGLDNEKLQNCKNFLESLEKEENKEEIEYLNKIVENLLSGGKII